MLRKCMSTIALFSLMLVFLVGCGGGPVLPPDDTSDGATPTPVATPGKDNPNDGKTGSFLVKSVSLIASPTTIYHVNCGGPLTVIYLAHFTLEGNTSGGTLDVEYSTDQWKTVKKATITVEAGKNDASYSFSSVELAMKGMSSIYSGHIRSVSPNQSISNIAKATGTCQTNTW